MSVESLLGCSMGLKKAMDSGVYGVLVCFCSLEKSSKSRYYSANCRMRRGCMGAGRHRTRLQFRASASLFLLFFFVRHTADGLKR